MASISLRLDREQSFLCKYQCGNVTALLGNEDWLTLHGSPDDIQRFAEGLLDALPKQREQPVQIPEPIESDESWEASAALLELRAVPILKPITLTVAKLNMANFPIADQDIAQTIVALAEAGCTLEQTKAALKLGGVA